MKPRKRNARLAAIAAGALALAGAAWLVTSALRQSIAYYSTPTEIAQNTPGPGRKLSLGGMVEKGSVKRGDGLNVNFQVTDFKHTVTVHYDKVLPDLFREGQGVVAEGHLARNGVFNATRVLAKHDEKYMPPQVARAVGKDGKGKNASQAPGS